MRLASASRSDCGGADMCKMKHAVSPSPAAFNSGRAPAYLGDLLFR